MRTGMELPVGVRSAVVVAAALGAFACGGDDGGSGGVTQPPPPTAVATVEVSPGTVELRAGDTQQLTATTRDATGGTLTGRAVTWSSNDPSATVSSTGLVTAVVAGTATITATAEGRSGSAAVTITPGDFMPLEDVELQGVVEVVDVVIPAGVTVTVTGALQLTATGTTTVDGSMVGDCVAIGMALGESVTVRGTIDNACSVAPASGDVPGLSIVGTADMEFDGADITTSGDLEVKNDPTLTEADFPEAQPGGGAFGAVAEASRWSSRPAVGASARMGTFSVGDSRFVAPPAPKGTDALNGGQAGQGGQARDWRLLARGDLVFKVGALVAGQDGGDGGDALHRAPGDTEAHGGRGNDGGNLRVLATGTIRVEGQTTFRSGRGGDGGSGLAESTGGDGPQAGSAIASGGRGGESGTLRVEGQQGLAGAGNLTLEIGRGGDGGPASAFGADGTICIEGHGQHGGDAQADGGRGGDSPDARLRIGGGVQGSPQLAGAKGGDGGFANARAGNGLDGQNCDDCKDGGAGGNARAFAGDGGDSDTERPGGGRIGAGGNGGPALIEAGNGGKGADCCTPEPKPGGDGGQGGNGRVEDGEGGRGEPAGADGGVVIAQVGNGGDAGEGLDSGQPGGGGAGTITAHGTRNEQAPNFQPGNEKQRCPPQPEEFPSALSLTGTLVSTFGPWLFGSTISNPGPIDLTVTTVDGVIQVTITSDADVVGTYDPATGAYSGEGSVDLSDGRRLVEKVEGVWQFDESGRVILVGTLTFEIFLPNGDLECSAVYSVRYTAR